MPAGADGSENVTDLPSPQQAPEHAGSVVVTGPARRRGFVGSLTELDPRRAVGLDPNEIRETGATGGRGPFVNALAERAGGVNDPALHHRPESAANCGSGTQAPDPADENGALAVIALEA